MVSYTRQDTRTVFQTSSLPSLLFQHSTVSPQGGNRPLRGTDQKLHARKGVFFCARFAWRNCAQGPPRYMNFVFVLKHILSPPWHTKREVRNMSYVSPKIKAQFESMPINLKNAILERDVRLENMADLMACLERIIEEGESNA